MMRDISSMGEQVGLKNLKLDIAAVSETTLNKMAVLGREGMQSGVPITAQGDGRARKGSTYVRVYSSGGKESADNNLQSVKPSNPLGEILAL